MSGLFFGFVRSFLSGALMVVGASLVIAGLSAPTFAAEASTQVITPASANGISVQTIAPTLDSHGRATIRIPAASIYSYTPLVGCDSPAFRMAHFSSFFERGVLTVEFRYVVRDGALGSACTVFFAADELEEFDFGSGEALNVAPQTYKFVINR